MSVIIMEASISRMMYKRNKNDTNKEELKNEISEQVSSGMLSFPHLKVSFALSKKLWNAFEKTTTRRRHFPDQL